MESNRILKTHVMATLLLVFAHYSVVSTETYPECVQQPADILFLVDGSGSVGNSSFQSCLQFISIFIDFFDIEDKYVKMSAFAFDERTCYGFYLDRYSEKRLLKSAIANISYPNAGQDFEMALRHAREYVFKSERGARDNAHKIIVFITDGQSDVGSESDMLQSQGVTIFALGVGVGVDINNLREIATSNEYVYPINSYGVISSITSELINNSCTEMLKNPCDTRPCKNATDCIWTGGTNFTCICISGYTGKKCEIDIDDCVGITCYNGGTCKDMVNGFTCHCAGLFSGKNCEIDLCQYYPADIVFILDSSYSVHTTYFDQQKQIVKKIVHNLTSYHEETRIGLVSYSTMSTVNVNLQKIADYDDFESIMDHVKFQNGSSFLHKALQDAICQFNSYERRKIVIVLFDGMTSDPQKTVQEAETLKRNNVLILTAEIGNDVFHEHTLQVAGKKENVFINHFAEDIYQRLVYELSGDICYVCRYTNYTDMVFLVDCSTDTEQRHLKNTIPEVLKNIVTSFPVGPKNVRYSLITYGTKAEVKFELSRFIQNDTEDIKAYVSILPKLSGRGNISSGLEVALKQFQMHQTDIKGVRKRQLVIISSFKTEINDQSINTLTFLKHNLNVEVIIIGMDCYKKKHRLNQIATSAAHTYYISNDVKDSIETVKGNMQMTSCDRR